ncbi:MAG: CpXC domain-containing protein [Chloroflexota bacterium]|nr:CpXC domain-containing protein [Chloroflexota bacterium]
MPIIPQRVTVTCPACGTQFTAEVHRVIDVGQNPDLKQQFLSGQLNQATCPNCGNGGILALPFLYHDPQKELALVFLPADLEIPEAERQRLIGSLTNEAMMNLPSEQRRSYLLQPQIFLRIERLMERVLEADGVTQEMLDAHRARVELLDELLAAYDDEEKLRELVSEHKEDLNYEFFQILTASLEAAQADERTDLAERLLKLRSSLLELSDLGRSSRAQREISEALEEGISREELLERLVASEDEAQLRGIVAGARPQLDYQFFLMLSNRIESAAPDEAQQLRELREKLLELIEGLDREAEAAMKRSSEVLQAILESDDREAAARDHLTEIDDLLLMLLSAQVQQAEAEGQEERAAELRGVWETVINVLEEAMPPEIQLINRLLRAETEEARQALMEEQRELITPDLVGVIEAMASNLAEQERPETAERLRSVRAEVSTFLES